MDKIENISGVILSGGKSKRMGTDKALLKIGDTPAIEMIYNTISGIFHDIMIISDYPKNYDYLSRNIYPDIYKSMGPLGGIHSALTNAENSQIFIVSCDIPLISDNIIRYIVSKKNDKDITLPIVFGRLQPLCGIYSKKCMPVFDDILSIAVEYNGKKSQKIGLIKTLENFDLNIIDFDYLHFNRNHFLNMNDQEDYKKICEIVDFTTIRLKNN